MSTELVPVEDVEGEIVDAGENGSALEKLAELEALIPAAVEEGAAEWLKNLGTQAEAAALYERRRHYGMLEERCMRLKIRAEAGIGEIDIRKNADHVQASGPLVIGSEEIDPTVRSCWRSLAIAQRREMLDGILERASTSGELSMKTVRQAIWDSGVNHVPAADVGQLITRHGLTCREAARLIGLRNMQITGRVGVHWLKAERLAIALGQDPRAFVAMRRHSKPRPRERRWLHRERKPSGGQWDEVQVRFIHFRTQIAALMPNAEPKWDEAYEHLHSLQDFIHDQMKREGMR